MKFEKHQQTVSRRTSLHQTTKREGKLTSTLWLSLVIILIGAVGSEIQASAGGIRAPFLVILILGGFSLCWTAVLIWRANTSMDDAAAALQQRDLKRSARARRRQLQNARIRGEQDANLAARQKLEAERHAAHAREQQIKVEQRWEQLNRETKYFEIRDQLNQLENNALPTVVARLMSVRGFSITTPADEAPFDMVGLNTATGAYVTVRCAPVDRTACSADVRELNLWRSELGAEQAYLISLKGFEEGAVNVVQHHDLPVLLAESHILAGWALNAEMEIEARNISLEG